MNDSRNVILNRIRRALLRPGTRHGELQRKSTQDWPETERIESSQLLEQFQEESAKVGGEPRICADIKEAVAGIKHLIADSGYRKVNISNHEICRRHQLAQELVDIFPELSIWSEQGNMESEGARRQNSGRLAEADLSITGAEFLIAETGTVLLTSTNASRQISLLPTAHLVLARPDQIYRDLESVFEHLEIISEEGQLPAALTLVTGPSRTADIEKVLIKGAHGPVRQLTWVIRSES